MDFYQDRKENRFAPVPYRAAHGESSANAVHSGYTLALLPLPNHRERSCFAVRLLWLFFCSKVWQESRKTLLSVRLLVPVVLFDSCVCAADMTGTMFFNVRPEFQPENCEISSSYLPAYVVLRLVSLSHSLISRPLHLLITMLFDTF